MSNFARQWPEYQSNYIRIEMNEEIKQGAEVVKYQSNYIRIEIVVFFFACDYLFRINRTILELK